MRKLDGLKEGILKTEQDINFNINQLLNIIPVGNDKVYTLSSNEIQSLKEDNIPQDLMLFFSIFGCKPETLSFPQKPLFSLIDSFIYLCHSTMRLCLIQQQIHDLYYEQEFDSKTRNEILIIKNLFDERMSEIKEEVNKHNIMLDEISQSQIQFNFKQEENNMSLEQGFKETQEQTLKSTKQTDKDNKIIINELKDIKRKQTVSDATIKTKIDKSFKKVEKTHKKESRCELTQMDCARVIAEERKRIYGEKKRLLETLKMTTETIDKDKNPDEKNIVRTIERWDSGKTKPPVGYSRRISEYEFREWVKKREKRKLDNWIVKMRKSLTKLPVEKVPEAVLDEWLRLDRGNDDAL